jgi:hypothetical protein
MAPGVVPLRPSERITRGEVMSRAVLGSERRWRSSIAW